MRTDADKWEQQMRKTLEMEEIPFLESDWDAAKQHIANQPKKDRKIGGIWLWMCIMGLGIVLVWGIGSRYEGLQPFVRQTECVENKSYENPKPLVRTETQTVETLTPKTVETTKPNTFVKTKSKTEERAVPKTLVKTESKTIEVTVPKTIEIAESKTVETTEPMALRRNEPKTFERVEPKPFVKTEIKNYETVAPKTFEKIEPTSSITTEPKTFVIIEPKTFVKTEAKTVLKLEPQTLLRFKPREKSFSMSAYTGIAHSFNRNYHPSIYGGLAAHYQFHPQWKVQLFAEYQERSAQFNASNLPNAVQSDPLADSVDITQYANGSITTSNFVTKTESLFRKQLQYVGVGAGLNYSLHRHSFFANASFLKLIDSRSLKKVTIQDNQSLIYQNNQTLNGFLTGIHPIDITVGLGYNYQISPKWQVNFSTNWGLLDISEDSFYKNTVKNRNFQVRTGISYRLF